MVRTSYIFQYHGENKLHFPVSWREQIHYTVSWREQVTFWCDDDDDDDDRFELDQHAALD